MDHRLGDADVAGRDALVEAADALRLVDAPDAFAHRHAGIAVQLHARLDEPYRVGGGGRDEPGAGCAQYVHQRRVGRNDAARKGSKE